MTTRHIETITTLSGRIKARLVYDPEWEEYHVTIHQDGKVIATYHSNVETAARHTMLHEMTAALLSGPVY